MSYIIKIIGIEMRVAAIFTNKPFRSSDNLIANKYSRMPIIATISFGHAFSHILLKKFPIAWPP
jgi:hypothetical protein